MSPALWSILIQATGSAATLGAALLVAWRLGLAAQGEFGLLRSWSDVLVMAAVVGLPQGLLHMQYREGAAASALRRWAARYLAGLAIVSGVVILLIAVLPMLAALQYRPQIMVLVAALPLFAAHQLWRSLTLRGAGVVAYAAVTAAPAILILVALIPFAVFDWKHGFEWALFAAAAVASLFSGWLALRIAPWRGERQSWSRRQLWSVSLQTGAQSVLTSLSPATQLSVIGLLGAPLAQIGIVSLGLHIYQLFGVAAVYAAPLLYDNAARRPTAPTLGDLTRQLRVRVGRAWQFLFGIAVAAGVIGPWAARLVWPGTPLVAVMVTLMTLAGLLALAVRLLSTLQQARGEYRALSLQALARLVGGTLFTVASLLFWPASVAVPLAMLAVEVVLLAWLLTLLQRAERKSS